MPVVVQFRNTERTDSLYIGAGKDKSGFEYSMGATWKANDNPVLIERALDWKEAVTSKMPWWHSGRRVIIYCISQVHAERVADACNARGWPARVLLDSTPDAERKQSIADFRDGTITHLVNVNLVTEGFDVADADCVLMLRPTQSLVVYLQQGGRTMRPSDAPVALILDTTNSTMELGYPFSQNLEWSLKPRGTYSPVGEAKVKECPHCQATTPISTHNCPLCGEPFGRECLNCGVWRPWRIIPKRRGECLRCTTGRQATWDDVFHHAAKQPITVTWSVSQNKKLVRT